MTNRFFDRYGKLILWVAVLTSPIAAYASLEALERNHNRVEDWLPRHLPETQEYVWFLEHFQGDELLVVSWPDCTIDDERLDRLVASATARRDEQGRPLFRRAWTGRSVLARMTGDPSGLAREEALERMRGWILGQDGRATCAAFMVDSLNEPDRHAAVAAVIEIATNECGIERTALNVGGPTADNVYVDRASTESLYFLSAVSILLGLAVSWWFLRSFRLVGAVFATSLLCELWSLALVTFTGAHVDAVLIMMPALVYILAVCGCIHLLNCYREAVVEHGPAAAPAAAVAFAWRPTVMASFTTSIGLLSLCVSDLEPVRRFGLFAAIGVVTSTGFLFTVLPALLTQFARRVGDRRDAVHFREDGFWETAVARLAIDHRRLVTLACAASMAVLAYGATRITTSAKIRDFFRPDSEVLTTYRVLEERIGPVIPVDVVLRFADGGEMSMLERVELSGAVRDAVERLPHLGGFTSAATFVPTVRRDGGATSHAQRVIANRLLARNRADLVSNAYLAEAPGEELWLVSGRAEAFAPIDYGELLKNLEDEVIKVVRRHQRLHDQKIEVVVCGGIPLINTVQQRLLRDLAASFGTTVAMIGLLLTVALRSARAAAILLIPNVFPTAVVFGLMGWYGATVDLGSMMTISTALGISVDNELHFIAWFRKAVGGGLSRRDALLATFRHCGGPMMQTAFVCGLGMLVFAVSGFLPTARFGVLMCVLIWTAAACDLVILPALLAGPAGRFFVRDPEKRGAAAKREEEKAAAAA
jgi:predicted RND superfamily exporter protein